MIESISRRKLTVTQQLSASFLLVILIGSLLLSLPLMHNSNAPATTYLDHLFNTVSMVCVTGLSVVPVSQAYNGLGQLTAMLLMQIGGLGLVTLVSLSYYSLKQKMTLSDQSLLQSALSRSNSSGLRPYLFFIYKLTFCLEGVAALILMIDFIPRFGWGHGIFNSLFLAVSAFCNAGFDNFSTTSLTAYATNPIVNITVAFLIIAGGLGFANWLDLVRRFKAYWLEKPRHFKLAFQPLSIHTRLVLYTTATILLLGTVSGWLLELNNPGTLARLNPFQQGMVSFFQSVTMRTAGFATIDYQAANKSTNLLYMLQMIIGGAPGGTAGGIKVTVAALIFLLFKSELKGQKQVVFKNRSIPQALIRQTLTILIFFFLALLSGYFLLLITEPKLDSFSLLFEAISALATVGVSMDVTPNLSTAGRFIIMALMFFGRVGPITVLLSLLNKPEKNIRYAETDLTIA